MDIDVKKPLKYFKKPLLIRRFTKRKVSKAGRPPGTLVHTGETKVDQIKISVIDYSSEKLTEREAKNVEDCFPFKKTSTVTWINITGLHEVNIIEKLGTHFGLHPLLLEDILNTQQRPKLEDFEAYMFLVLRMLTYNEISNSVNSEQVSFVIGKNFVISFQEAEGDVFEPVRLRIRKSKGRFRKSGPDYLAYALIDAVIDNYFLILEKLGEKIEDLEEQLALEPKQEYLRILHNMKRETIFLRKSVWPLREVISGLQRGDSKIIKQTTKIYLRDVYDHTIQVIDTVETFRDILSGMLDLYMSGVSNKTNEIMKVLTIFAAIFIPLTFVAGVYGMNFKNMPETNWQNGYFFALSLMAAILLVMLLFFKRKRWL